jgi:hypothetical protein
MLGAGAQLILEDALIACRLLLNVVYCISSVKNKSECSQLLYKQSLALLGLALQARNLNNTPFSTSSRTQMNQSGDGPELIIHPFAYQVLKFRQTIPPKAGVTLFL